MGGGAEVRRQQQRADDADIEHDLRRRRRGEAADGVEHTAHQDDQRDQRQIGEGDAGELHRRRKAHGIVGKTRRHQPHHRRHEDEGEDQQHELGEDEEGEDPVGEDQRGVLPALGRDLGEARHEGGGEGALGEDGAELVGNAEGDEEGIRQRPGAEDRGEHQVAHEAEQAADEGDRRDREDVPDHGRKVPRAILGRSEPRRGPSAGEPAVHSRAIRRKKGLAEGERFGSAVRRPAPAAARPAAHGADLPPAAGGRCRGSAPPARRRHRCRHR